MNVAIVGSRNFNDYNFLKREMFSLIEENNIIITKIVSGGAKGVDAMAEKFARDINVPAQIFKPDWDKLGRKAGPLRNTKIIQNSDIVVAFWNGKSTGTHDSIKKARLMNKILFIIKV